MGNYTSVIEIYCCNTTDDDTPDPVDVYRFDESNEETISEAPTIILPNAF